MAIQKRNVSEAVFFIEEIKREKGLCFLKELDGAFQLAYWNRDLNEGFIFKSLLCKQSLYYKKEEFGLKWSSDVEKVTDKNIPIIEQIERKQILNMCMGDVLPSDVSNFKDIFRLPAGCLLSFHAGSFTIECLDKFRLLPTIKGSPMELSSMVREIIDGTIKKRLDPKDDKIAVILSGGLDSSVILTSLYKMGLSVTGIHWSFSSIPSADELMYAKLVTDYLKVPLIEIDTQKINQEGTYLKQDWDFPVPYNHSFYAFYEMVKNECKRLGISTLGSGYLGDTLFGPEFQPVLRIRDVFSTFSFKNALRYTREAFGCPLESKASSSHPRLRWYEEYLTDNALSSLTEDYSRLEKNESLSSKLASFSDNEAESWLEYSLFERHGIHFNHLFASKELMEFSLALPTPMKVIPVGGQWIEKPILRLAFLGDLPRKIVSRNHRQLMSAWNEVYVLRNKKQVYNFMDGDSFLSKFGIIDNEKLKKIFIDPKRLALIAPGLICCVMTELWLRSISRRNGVGIVGDVLSK